MSLCVAGSGWGDPSSSSSTNGGGGGVAAANGGWQQTGPPGAGSQVPTVADGWGGPSGPSSANTNWNSSNSSQWAGTSPGNASSWSQVASKNVPQTMAPPPHQPAVRPKGASFDPTNGWGSAPVDQGTPWQEPSGGGGGPGMKFNEWNPSTGSWGAGNKDKQDAYFNKQQQQQYGNDRHSSSSQWNPGNVNGPQNNSQWNAGQNSGRSNSNSYNDHHQQQQASNVWTGPPSSQGNGRCGVWTDNGGGRDYCQAAYTFGNVHASALPIASVSCDGPDNSMVWNNPYPKKTFQPDKGTNAWGDPTAHASMEIKRWKASSDDTAPSADIPPVIVTTAAAQSASVWSDSPMAPQPPKSSWNDNSPSNVSVSNQNSSVTSPVWDNNNVNNSSKSTAPSSFGWGASDNGWNGPSKLNETNRQSAGNVSAGDLDSDSISTDDVFSNPITPLTPFGPLQNGTCSNLPAKYPIVAQSAQQSTTNSMQNNAQLQQILTKQISMQLKQCVQAGLIDIQLLNQQLSEESLHRLNQLLSIVPNYEKAQLEMQRLQMLQRQGQTLNPSQNQDLKRLSEDVQRYTVKIQQIKHQINNKQRQMSNGSTNGSTNDVLSPVNGANDSFSQSKLSQWKNGSSSDSHEKKLSVSSSAPNLENFDNNIALLTLNAAGGAQSDTWSTNKRHSGADWPSADANKNEKNPHANQTINSSFDSNSFDGVDSYNHIDSDGRVHSLDDNRQDFPPEFKPGQPWPFRDPSKAAEDPNATPGSIKPNALTKLNLDSAFSNTSYGGHNFGFSGMQSAFGSVTPTKMNFDVKPATISPSMSVDSYMTTQRHSRPPSTLGQPFNRPPMMKQPFSAPFVPYNNLAQWIVLTNVNQIDEHSLQILMNRFGTTTTLVCPPASGLAFIKFRDTPYERLLPRMQQELAPFGVSVQIMKENEVERLLQALSNRAQPSALFNPNAAHAPPPLSGVLWDAPPPPIGPWGPGGHHPYAPGLPMPDGSSQFTPNNFSFS